MNFNLPLVSVCCITYNHAAYIAQALESFLEQKTSFFYEILVYDDASTDDTVDILKKFESKHPDRIRVFYSSENQYGKGVRLLNLRFNLPRARGKYIATCDGDDFWTDPLKLQKQVDFLEGHPEVVLCFHSFDRLENDVRTPSSIYRHLSKAPYTILDQKDFLQLHVQFLTIMFRKGVKFPLLSKEINGDVFVLTYLSEKGKTAYLNFNGAVYRYHSDGVFRKMSKIGQIHSSIQTRRLISDQVKPLTRKFLYMRISTFYKTLFREALKVGNYSLGVKAIFGVVYYKIKYAI